MKTITAQRTFPVSRQQGWEMLADIPNYPRFVPFIKDAMLPGLLEEGVVWHDTTNILWVTQRVAHHVKVVEKHERLVFVIPVIGGEVREELVLEEQGQHTKITMSVSISIRPRIVEETVGRILAKRFNHMLTGTLANLEAFFANQ